MLICLIRSVILYIVLVAAVRLMGKRQIGEMEPAEFVVAMLVADLASVPMQDLGIPLLSGIIPILAILAIELLLSVLCYHFIPVRKLLCGNPVILMEHGKIIQKNLQRTRLTPDELKEQLREKDIFDLSVIQYAILETNGQISALIDAQYKPPTAKTQKISTETSELPITLISNGKLLHQNLAQANVTENWIRQELRARNCSIQDVVLFTLEKSGRIYFSGKDR